jgi:integrase/recombinase XerD
LFTFANKGYKRSIQSKNIDLKRKNMPVYLRKKVGSKKSRYYLDIYHSGQRSYEFLDLYQIASKNPFETEMNRQNKEIAEQIRAKRQLELEAGNYQIEPKHKKQIYFLDYFDRWVKQYRNKDIRLAKACHNHFLNYLKEAELSSKITTRQITKELVKEFRDYLDTKLNGETPFNYFSKFIKLCNDATEAGIFTANPCIGIKNRKPDGLKKDILNVEEIIALREADCPNAQIKNAFLFCLNTGLRWVDVKGLKWLNLNGDVLKMTQSKTTKEVVVYLNEHALSLLPERTSREYLVFTLPSSSMALKHLATWVGNAKIDKHITWHSARHSFAVNLLINKVDVKTMSSLLGHAGLKHTEKYTRVVDELKRQAVKTINF